MVVNRFEVWLAELDPIQGSEIRKTRPCLIISPNEMNSSINTVIIAPMTSKGRHYPTRIPFHFRDKAGLIVLDQIRTVDKTRLLNFLGVIDLHTQPKIISVLQEIFAE